MDQMELLGRKLKRESEARKEAEKLLENKSLELYELNKQLTIAMKHLEIRSAQQMIKLEFEEHIDKLLIKFGHSFLAKKLDEILLQTFVRRLSNTQVIKDLVLLVNVDFFQSFNCAFFGNASLLKHQHPIDTPYHWQDDILSVPILMEGKQVGCFIYKIDFQGVDREAILTKLTLVGELVKVALSRSVMSQREVQLRMRAEESERATKEFVAMINHELRTPLNGVLGGVELLQKTGLDSLQKQYLNNITQGGELLRVVINDMLDLSKMNAGMLEITQKTFLWSRLEESIEGIFAAKSIESGLEFIINKSNIPISIIGDLERIKQILVNLIGNAFKFTKQGKVTLNAHWESDKLYFEVVDTGIGITKEAQNNLFDPFVQVDRSSRRLHEGSGLGLAICRNLASLMGGNIYCESQLGKGSTFYVELSVLEGETTENTLTGSIEEVDKVECDLKKLRVLVVDDAKLNQIIVKQILGQMGVFPDIRENGKQAIMAVEQENFDIVFMDCRMPEMDGFEATRRLREKGFTMPIIALTACATLEENAQCIESGMNAILNKPYTSDEIKQMMIEWGAR